MKPSHFRHLLSTMGYTQASARVPILDEAHAERLATAWLAWRADPDRALTALEIAGAPIETTLASQM